MATDYKDQAVILENTSGSAWTIGYLKFYVTYQLYASGSDNLVIRLQDVDGSSKPDGTDNISVTIPVSNISLGLNTVALTTSQTVANGAKLAVIFDAELDSSLTFILHLRGSTDGETLWERSALTDGEAATSWVASSDNPPWIVLAAPNFTEDTSYKDYVASTSIKATTIADTTILVNPSATPAMDTTTSTDWVNEALVYVKKTAESTQHIYIDDSLASTTTMGSTHDAGDVRDNMVTALEAWDTGGLFTFTKVRDTMIHVTRVNGGTFKINCQDTYNDQAVQCVNHQVEKFSDLPPFATDGFIVEVTGTDANKFNSYYLKYTEDSDGSTGVWKETVSPGVEESLDATTMPSQMVRTSTNTFTVGPIAWADRLVGDAASNPDPSFVGTPINDVFFHKNRLGFLAGENVVMSKTADFFDFFAATMLDILDDDPIDVAVDTSDVSYLHSALPFNEQLLVFSDRNQFVLSGGGAALTPTSVTFNLSTRYNMAKEVKPIGLGPNVYFSVPKGGSTTIREYFVQTDTVTNDAADITAHVPTYIPENVNILVGSSSMEFLMVGTIGDPDVYFYKYQWSGEEKVQSSWNKWTLPYNVLGMGVIRNKVYIVGTNGTQTFIEVMDTEKVETGTLDFRVHLDRMELLTGVYSGGTTTFTLSYTDGNDDFYAVDSVTGAVYPLTDASDTTKTYTGDISTNDCYVGRQYTSTYRFTEFGLPQEDSNVLTNLGRLQMRRLTIGCQNTGYIKLSCTPYQRTAFTRTFEDTSLFTEAKKFIINSAADQLVVELVNDSPLPWQIMTGVWEGVYSRKGSKSIG